MSWSQRMKKNKMMEIERKFLVTEPLPGYEKYPSHAIEQAYLCTDPVVRVRRSDEDYYMTYKGRGLLAREEYNLPLNREAYEHLRDKADGILLTKRRYEIPLAESGLVIELDIFSGRYEGLILAEVEFASLEQAKAFQPPAWFGEEVTESGLYQNSRLSKGVQI